MRRDLENITQMRKGGNVKTYNTWLGNLKNFVVNEYLAHKFEGIPRQEVKKRLYRNLKPSGYEDALNRLEETVVNNKSEYPDSRQQDTGHPFRDDIFAEYLGIPQKNRRSLSTAPKVVASQYHPTKGYQSWIPYKTLKGNDNMWKRVYDAVYRGKDKIGFNNVTKVPVYETTGKSLGINKNKVSGMLSEYFGPHTVSRGYDDRGEYMAFYDKWDIAPVGGSNASSDESAGIGTPIHFYDRMYLDDYFGVGNKNKDHATYLPEVIIEPDKKKKYGGVVRKHQLLQI